MSITDETVLPDFARSTALQTGVQVVERASGILSNIIDIQKEITSMESNKQKWIAGKSDLEKQNSRQGRSQAYVKSFSPAYLLLPNSLMPR